ncbi:hypothetical protein ACP70R_040248 [Stipagrostis hirtigluma subsp. patula]
MSATVSQVASIDSVVGFVDPQLQPQVDAAKIEEALVETLLATTPSNCDKFTTTPVLPTLEPPVEDLPTEQERMQVVTPAEDVVIVEDAADDEAVADADRLENSIFLVTIKDSLVQPTTEVKANVAQSPDDTPMKETSSLDVTPVAGEDLTNPPSPPVTRARRRRESYNRSSLRRSARLAQRNMLKDLGVLENDGKLNEKVLEDYVDFLKELVPPDLLQSLSSLKGLDFWNLVAGISLPLRQALPS